MTALAVFTTIDTEAAARELARQAVEARLAACVQIERIESVYRWDGAVQAGPEYRLLFKTTDFAYDALAALIRAVHPYDQPALWAAAMAQGDPGFLAWIAGNSDGGPVKTG
jgi:periplasmic divalent cation tolerance protein